MPIVKVDNLGDKGLERDGYGPSMEPNAFTEAQNFRFRLGHAERMDGYAQVYGTPSGAPIAFWPYSDGSGRSLVYASTTKMYKVNSAGTHTDISGAATFAAGAEHRWHGGVLGGILVATNNVDLPQYWPGTGNVANLTNWPASTYCKVIRPFRNHLIALNITKTTTNYPHMIKWSHPADPGAVPASWDETDPVYDAGEIDIPEDYTRIVDGCVLGEQFIVFKENSYWSLQYIGPPYIFRLQKISMAAGCLATGCVAEFPMGLAVLGQGDFYVMNGGEPQSIVNNRMQKWLSTNIDTANYKRCMVAHAPLRKEVVCGLVPVGESTIKQALVWNYAHNTIGVRDLPSCSYIGAGIMDYTAANAWSAQTEQWETISGPWNAAEPESAQRLILASSANTKLYVADYGQSAAGTAFSSKIERTGLDLGDPSSVKLVKQVRPLIDGDPGAVVNVWVGGSMDQRGAPGWSGPYPFTIGTDQKIDCLVSGRFISYRLASDEKRPWRVKRVEFEVEQTGYF